MKKVLVPLAPGCEEMEAVILIDVLRRAGVDVVSAGLAPDVICASRGVRLVADIDWSDLVLSDYEAIILPGGLDGTKALMAHEGVQGALHYFAATDGWITAICAAPAAIEAAGLLAGKEFTCYPGSEQLMETPLVPSTERVVVDGKMVTSQGPGTAIEFALKLVTLWAGEEAAQSVAEGMLV